MLPEIVRAAAEPMANIDSLTVLSTDGASDVVKNVTRTVTEASATVKGLTGIDIPELLNNAVGGSGQEETPSGGAAPKTRGGGSGGSGATGRRRPSGGAAATSGPAPASASAQTPATPTEPAWGSRPPTVPAPAAPASSPAPTASAAPTRPAPPQFDGPEAVNAALASADEAIRKATGTASDTAKARTDTAAGPARPSRATLEAAGLDAAGVTRETTVDEAARKLAVELRDVPGIERFGGLRLADLETGGPRPLRTMWRIARDQLDERYGGLTIGELIERYGGDVPPPG